MSSSVRIYLGPYVECTSEMKNIQAVRVSCPNTECANHTLNWNGMKYCSLCGAPFSEVYYTIQAAVIDAEALESSIYSSLLPLPGTYAKSQHIWVGNIDNSLYYLEPYNREDRIRPITSRQMEEEQWLFGDERAAVIQKLIEDYGQDNVAVKWGFLYWID